MTEVKFTKASWKRDREGAFWLMLKVDESDRATVRKFVATMPDRPHAAELKPLYGKRSPDANSYCWALIGQLSAALRIPPEEVYRQAIKDIGGNYYTTPIPDDEVERWKKLWQSRGLGWICEEFGMSCRADCTDIICYYGSSVYDTRQMSRLIDCIVYECEAQGIETKTPDELARLKREWV